MLTTEDWRTVLIATHPRLFGASGESPERTPGYPECGDGWSDLLRRLCGRIDKALGPRETIRVAQIKEKFAGLRFYWHGKVSKDTEAAIQEAISLAEARSFCCCEECGAEGSPYRYGMLMTRCPAHAKGQRVSVEPGMENVHVVRYAIPAGGFRKVARRYDRATDMFVEIHRTSSGNEG